MTAELSVVVTIVDGGDTLVRHLEALTAQTGGHRLEVLVPYDHLSAGAAGLAERFPAVRFIDLGIVLDGAQPRNPLELHAFYDLRRAEALKRATAPLIAITEDRGIPRSDWAAAMIRLHADHPDAVIGGAVENGVDRLVNWAIFFCDFGRYQPPLDQADPEYVTDTNICYKRAPLMAIRELWEAAYQEPVVNWSLRRSGAGLRISDAARTVQHRPPIGLAAAASERYHWARLFGMIRSRDLSRGAVVKLAVLAPALPMVLFVRHFRRQLSKGHHLGAFLGAAPVTVFLLMCWSAGELAGYLQGLVRRRNPH